MEKEEYFEIEDNSENSNPQKSLGAITNSYYNDNSQENSKIEINNKNEKNSEQIKELSNNSLLKSNNYIKNKNNLLESEEIFINQKKEIQKAREKNLIFLIKKQKNKDNNINESKNIKNNDLNDDIKIFSLNDNKYFEVSIFNYNEDEEKPQIPEFNEPWKPSNILFSLFSEK